MTQQDSPNIKVGSYDL